MENKKQDKIDKILQKVEQKSSKIYNEDNDPVIAAANLLQTEEYMKGLKDPSFSSVFNTQMKLQDIEAKKDLYKAAKLQEEFSTEPYDDRYVDLATGEIKRISENKNYNMKLQTYDLASNFKSFLSGFAGDAIQGVGLGLDTAYNGLIGGLASVGEIGQYIFNGEEKNAQTRKQLEKDLADNFDRISLFTDIANTLATPFNEYERDKNFVNIHQDLDYLGESFDKGNVKEFAKELVNTGLHTVPTMVEGLLSYGAAVPALAKLNKENQAKELGVNSNEILDTTNKASLAELAGATVYGLGGKLSLASMKGAVGRGLIGQSGKASSGFIDSVATPTRSVFDKLKPNTLGEDIPGLNAALKAGYYGTLGTGKAIKNLAKYGSGVGLVALGEGLSEGVQTAGEKIATGDFQNKSFEENYKDLEESMLLGAIAGGGLGAAGKAVTAPISYVANKTKEREIFETTKQNAAKLSKTLNVKDMFSSSIKETTDSKGNSHKTTKVESPLDKFSPAEVENINNLFHNLSQTSLSKYESDPQNTAEDSPLNVNKNIPLLNEVFSLGASGFLSNIQKDGTEIPSQTIIDESIGRAVQAVNEHIDSIIKTNPNTDTDEVISTLAEFKEKMKDNSALDYYVARQMLTNSDQVKQLLARAIGETSDTSVQNESEGKKLSSYENMTNAAIKQGQEVAVKEYTQEQLKNLKKVSKFISELTGIEELASNVDQKLNENKDPNATPKNTASSAVSRMLNRINNIITALETPEEKREDFRTNATLNTALGAILTGHTTSTGEKKKSLTKMLQEALEIVNKDGKQGVQKSEKVVEDIKSLKWWLNSHRAKYKLYKKVTSDLKEAEKGEGKKQEAIYMIPKEITPNGLGEVVKIVGKDAIIKYLRENFELDNELSTIISNLENKLNINPKGTMTNLRKNLDNRGLGYHIFTTMPHTKSSVPEGTLENIEREGIEITKTLDFLEGLSFTEEKINSIIKELNGGVNPTESDNSKDNTSKENAQTTTQPVQETAQEVKQDISKKDIERQPTPKQGNKNETQKISEEKSNNNNNSNNTLTNDDYASTAGIEIDEETLKKINTNTNIDNIENVDAIKENVANMLGSAIEARNGKVEVTNKDSKKEIERKAETQSRFLNLEKILKIKDNPKSLLSVPDTDLSPTIGKINNALKTSFGLKDTLDISGFISFFNMLGTSKYLDSGKKEYKDINNTITLFSNENVRLSAITRALGALTDSRFSYSDFKNVKEKYPNLKSRREIPSESLKYLLRGVSLSDIANDIGKRILSDIGLDINKKNATLADAERIYQELGIVAIMSLEYLKLVNVTDVKYATFYNNIENKNASEKRVILNLDNIYTKEGSGNLSTAISFITNLEEDLRLDKSDHESTYSTQPFNVREFVKTKQGVFALTKKMYKAINAFLNTPFVVENHGDVKEFIDTHEKELKSFLGYMDLSKYVGEDRKLIGDTTPTILYGETGIKYSDIDSVLGKNLQVENSINHLKDLLNDGSAAKDGIYFNKTFSSGRLWLQSATVNPQSNKLHRFLVTLKTQTKTEKVKDGNLSDSTYIAIAQAFGYKTDKETGAVNVGKAIVNTEGLKDKVIKALGKKGEIELGDGTKLEIEEIGHALNALFNIEKFLKAKEENPNLTEFRHNIVEEVDGINNGIALKGLTFFVSPKTIKTLLSTGISFFGELVEKVMPEKFSAEATKNNKANPDKAWDTYEEFAIVTSKGFKKTTEILSKPTSIELANLKEKEKTNADLSEKDKETLASNKDKAEVDYVFVNMAAKFGISTNKLQGLRKNVEDFGRAMSGINNLVFVGGDPDTVEKVSKEARKLNKYVVIPSSYGSGLTSNIRSLTTFVVDNFGDWVLKRIGDEKFEDSPEWGIVSAILDSLGTTNSPIKYTDYTGEEQELDNDNFENLKNFVLNNADGIGAAKVIIGGNPMSLYDFINSHMEVVTRQGVKESRDTILPGYESVNNTINSIHNLFQVILTNKYNSKVKEKLIDSGRLKDKNLEGNTIPTHLLPIAEHEEILNILRKDFPSITVDSKERFGENKEAKHVGRISMANMDKVRTSTNEIGIYYPGIYLHSSTRETKGEYASKPFSMGLTSKSIVFSSVGATPTAIMTQQKDGTDMIEAMIKSIDKNGQLDINDIFDAILRHSSDGSSDKSLISMYNRSQVNEALSSSQLYEQVALAAKAARDMSEIDEVIFNNLLSDKITNGINKGIGNYKKSDKSKEIVSPKEILVEYAKGLAAVMHTKYTISEVNKAVVKNLTTVASNMQNGHKSDKAKIEPERGKDLLKLVKDSIINDPYLEQDPKEYVLKNLMLDITEPDITEKLSSIEDMLNSIYDNRIPNNTKHLPNGTIEKFKTEIKELQQLIHSKIESIKNNLESVGAEEIADNLTRHVKDLGKGAFSLTPSRDKDTGRDKFLDEDEGRVASDNETVEEVKEETIEEEKVEENNSLSSNSPTKNNEIKESTKPDTNTAKESKPNTEYQGDMEVIERLTNALEQLLKPKSQKDKGVEGINPDVAKENTSARVEKVKNKINEILKVGFGKDVDLRKLGKGFTKLKESFKEKLENFNVDEYLKDPRTYIENLFKDIVGNDSIFDKINKEVLKSFENVDDTKVGDTSMDEFVSQIDLTTDKVSTTQEQMRSIDEANGRAMSKEFSNHLKGVLSELSSLASEAVNGVKVKYFKSKGKGHNEGEFLTNLREILIKEGIPLSKGNFTGIASLEETYGHELLHAITYYVIKALAGGNPLTRELSMLHKRYLSVMTPSKLAKYINSGIPSKDLEVANRIIKHFENNTIEGLCEFIAIALSNEAVWNSLKDIEVKSDPNYDGMTFGERVVAKAMKMFNTFFNSIYRKYQDNDNMQKAMIVLATKIATANSKAEYKIDKEMDYNTLETADTLTTVANSLATGLDKVDEVTSEKLNKLKDYVKSKGVKLVSVPKSRRRKYSSRWEEIRGLVAILASDVVGDKTAQAALSVAHDIGLHYNGVTQYVVSELSQMSEVKRKAEYLSRQRKLLDTHRAGNIKSSTEALEEYFNTPLTLAENQALGEGMLDTDLSSLLEHYSIDELPDILNNIESYKEKAYSDMLKEVDNNFKDRVGKYSKDDYKRYITNQANSLAYFMNFQSYRNEIEGAIGVKNPTMIAMAVGTGANLKPNKKVVSAIDKYVTLAALEYLESDVKDLIVDKLRTEPKGMEAMMNYHRTNKAESLEKNFGGNPALMIKGYRYDVVEDYIDIKIAPVSEESLLKSQGFRRVSKEPLRKSPDDNSEERAIYINDFIPSTASFNQQAVSYLGHTGRGSKLSDIYNDKILKGADARTVEQEWYDSIVDLTKNSSLAARKLMSPNYSPANYKDKKGSENIMIPIFDEHGDLRDFAYLMSKKTKKDLLGLDTSLTKSLSHMSARTIDKYEAQKLNERVADELYKDYAQANSAERQYHFVEMSFESKDPYIREIYKMLEPSFKNYLEEKFGGKIMVRASTMLNFFGQRDMDYRNTANYREKDVPYKKVLLASLDVARQVAKLAKMEIVLRFGSTIYNNFVSNGITLLIRGVPITSIVKDQIEGGRLLNKYLKDTKELKKLEAKKKAGGDVRDVEIENLKRELERNPIRDMMEFGLFSTIQTFEDINLDDKDNSWTARQVRKYTVENENISEGVREWMQKGYDWAFVTDRTVIGKTLTKLVQMGDFVARYALYKHYMRDNKMSKKEALEKVSDEFINYDLPVNKAVKFFNDYGFLFFTRYYIVSQKVMAMLASDRPVSAGLVVGLQAMFNTDFADILDGNVLTKNVGELVSDPFTNLFNSLSPTGYDLVKGAYSRI